jgi:hypothetical protein
MSCTGKVTIHRIKKKRYIMGENLCCYSSGRGKTYRTYEKLRNLIQLKRGTNDLNRHLLKD